jgi:hypothetical protein
MSILGRKSFQTGIGCFDCKYGTEVFRDMRIQRWEQL